MRLRDAEYELTKLTQSQHKTEAELHSKIIELESQLGVSPSSGGTIGVMKERSKMVEELEQKLSGYETQFIDMKETETRLHFELGDLKRQNDELKFKLENCTFSTYDTNHKLAAEDAKELEQKIGEDVRPSTLELFTSSPSKFLPNTEESDESEMYDNISSLSGRQERRTLSIRSTGKMNTPEKGNLRNNKYYKKYLKYKSAADDLRIQIQETKDRAIASLVEKEKKLMKLTQEFEAKEKKFKKTIEDLKAEKDQLSLCGSSKTLKHSFTSSPFSPENQDQKDDDFSNRMYESTEKYLKQKLQDLRAERDNSVKKLNLDFQALMAKYEDDVGYYKDLVATLQGRPTVTPQFKEDNSTPKSSGVNDKIIAELRENEEHYMKNEDGFKRKIGELEEKLLDYERLLEDKNSRSLVDLEGEDNGEEDFGLRVQAYEEQANSLKTALEEKELELEAKSNDFAVCLDRLEELQQRFDKLETQNEEMKSELKTATENTKKYQEAHIADVTAFEKEFKEKKEWYDSTISSLKIEIKNKDTVIKNLTEQLGDDDDFDDSNQDNPFLKTVSSEFEDNSLFDELGGDTGGRSFSICPNKYKSIAKQLKKRLSLAEAKYLKLRTELKSVLDEKATLELKSEIAEKELSTYKKQIEEMKQTHEKEVRSIQHQTRAAFAELQNLRKNNIKNSSVLEEEVQKLKEKCRGMEREVEEAKKGREELIEKNIKWAQEHNEQREEIIKIEQTAIDAKLHVANLWSLNDKLKFTLNEKNKEISKLKYYIQKYKIELPKVVRKQGSEALGD